MPAFAGRIVSRLRDQDDFSGSLTDEYFLSYEADTDSFVLAPVATTVALDDLTDVTLTSVAQGDVLYRGASQWNNLPPGTAGYALTTNGAGANPAWTNIASAGASIGSPIPGGTVGSVLFVGTGPVLAQDNANLFWNDTDNALLLAAAPPASAVKASLALGSALAGGSASGTYLGINAGIGFGGDFLRCQVNGSDRAKIDNQGFLTIGIGAANAELHFGTADASHPMIFNSFNELMMYKADISGFATMRCGPIYATGELSSIGPVSGILVNHRDNNAAAYAIYSTAGNLQILDANGNVDRIIYASGTGILTHTVTDAATNTVTAGWIWGHNTSGTPAAGFGSELRLRLESSTTEDREAAGLSWEWATATDASRKARGKLTAWDTAVREAIRWEASGSAPMVGFLGAEAAAQIALNAAATDAATTQALVNQIRAALITYGLAV